MPNKCCVPRCRGNYKNGSKVRIFRFPKDEELRQKWIRAIPRENYLPTENTRVCELHFHPEDITTETSYTDDSTGRTVTAPLPHARLLPGAIPSIFPDCPKYLTSQRSAREAPEAKRLRLESSALQKALQQSAETFQHEVEEDRIQSLKDLADYVRCNSSAFWHAIEANERLILLHIVDEDAPSIKYSFTIKPDLSIVFHYLKVPTQKLGRNISIPDVASGKREVMEVLEAIEKWDRDLISTATNSKGDTVEIVRALICLPSCGEKEEEDSQVFD
ncbi:hypothetical protein HPB48_025100 [Haemaphysalis longicornis]|uniref:THAP-type domain-containing protein n=1 Tax=Haemaphysalis longicornis TaxID=44386 RepID=A0A9J6H9E7_HAELO|nr:hypothetical protein HPB48_025100 [Haemaphysalis longicornis]